MGVPDKEPFNKDYYQQFYTEPKTRVTDQREIHRLGRFVASYLKYLRVPVTRVLDLGCGMGYWQPVIRRHYPRATYVGVEYSRFLCRSKGWQHGSVVDYQTDEPADLVICQGVLQYLHNRDAAKAINNLGRLSRGALYLEVLTQRDWDDVCDQSATDGDTFLRTADWYRERLKRHFRSVGGGVFLSRECDAPLYEMEYLDPLT
jgi:SAM-dependent methyltransferase